MELKQRTDEQINPVNGLQPWAWYTAFSLSTILNL